MFNGVGVVIGTYAYCVERSAATAVPDVGVSSELTAQVSHHLLVTSSTRIMESRPAHRDIVQQLGLGECWSTSFPCQWR